jgi:hypothetical protein
MARAAVLVLSLLLAGCVPSLHPLYTEKDLVYDAALLGVWVDDEGRTSWTVKRAGDKSYSLMAIDEKGNARHYEGHLLDLGKHRFLDLLPEKPEVEDYHLIRAHTFYRIWAYGDTFRLAGLDPDWIRKRKIAIRHELLPPKGMLLTAPTKSLQEFVLQYVEDPEAFPHQEEYRRRTR